MKLMKEKRIISMILCLVFSVTAILTPCLCFADEDTDIGSDLEDVISPVVDLINQILNIVLILVGAVGAIFCVFLGIKFAKAEEPQDREKAKDHLKNAIIGFVLIFVLILVLRLLMPVLSEWVSANDKV